MRRHRSTNGVCCLSAALDADGWDKALTALGPPTRKHLPATRRAHACPEAMGAFALDIARLVRSFHDILQILFTVAAETPVAESASDRDPCRCCHASGTCNEPNYCARGFWSRSRTDLFPFRCPPITLPLDVSCTVGDRSQRQQVVVVLGCGRPRPPVNVLGFIPERPSSHRFLREMRPFWNRREPCSDGPNLASNSRTIEK